LDAKLREKLDELSQAKSDLRALKTKEMRAETQLTVKDREVGKLQRQVLTQTQEIAKLQQHIKSQDEKMQKVMARRGSSTGGRLAGGGAVVTSASRARPTVSGGGKPVQRGDSRRDVFRTAGARSNEGASASSTPAKDGTGGAAAADPEQVEYV